MAQKPTLIYIADPMCSWCYGFSPEIKKVEETLKDSIEIQLVMGGLRPYNTETMQDLGDFLKEHWAHVEKRSEVEFNYDILSDKSFVYDTEPPARAVVLMREFKPESEFDFFRDVQKAFYADNKNTAEVQTYLDIVPKYGVDAAEFKEKFDGMQARLAIKEDYDYARKMGISGFPTTVLKVGDQYFMTSNGFIESERLLKTIENVLNEVDQK